MSPDCPHCDRELPNRQAVEDHVDRAHPDADEPTDGTRILLVGIVVLAIAAVAAAALFAGSGTDGQGFHVEDSPRTGNETAPVTLIAFESPACTSCQLFHVPRDGQPSTYARVQENYVRTGQVLYVEKFTPAGYGWDRLGANAQRCAWELSGWSAFESLTQAFYTNRDQVSGSNAEAFAREWAQRSTREQADTFGSCLDERRFDDKLSRDLADGNRASVSGTPTFLILTREGETRRIVGPQPYETFANALDTALAQAADGESNAVHRAEASGGGDARSANPRLGLLEPASPRAPDGHVLGRLATHPSVNR